jgi:choline dehydrogenase-like flavoprotein
MPTDDTYDYIVTGAGSAGCVVAARPSESGRYRVLLLEAGGEDRYPWIHVPMGYGRLFSNPRLNWMYESEPEPELEGRSMYQPRGKVLGGTSSINGMVYMRGNPADYDEWRQRGCTGWDWDSVLPYFKKAEDQERGPDPFHGTGGPLRVSDQPARFELAEHWIAAAIEAGLPANNDFNNGQQDGAGPFQSTTNRRRRWSTSAAYLRPARDRKNLTVATNALVTRVVFENGRATGVDQRLERPDIQLNFSLWSFAERTRKGVYPHPFPGFTVSAVHLRPDARGEVRLKSADPLSAPAIRFNFLKTHYDLQALTTGMRLARKIVNQPALSDYVADELIPGKKYQHRRRVRGRHSQKRHLQPAPGRHLSHGGG